MCSYFLKNDYADDHVDTSCLLVHFMYGLRAKVFIEVHFLFLSLITFTHSSPPLLVVVVAITVIYGGHCSTLWSSITRYYLLPLWKDIYNASECSLIRHIDNILADEFKKRSLALYIVLYLSHVLGALLYFLA